MTPPTSFRNEVVRYYALEKSVIASQSADWRSNLFPKEVFLCSTMFPAL